jgi:hypothetical protein
MSRTTFRVLASALALLCGAELAPAGSVQFQLGEQDFADGKTPVYSDEIRAAGAGEMFPFDGTIFGNDVKSAGLGSFGFTHAVDLGGTPLVAARLTVGVIDIDSTPEQPLDTVAVFFDGVAQPAELLRGVSAIGAKSSAEVVELPVPLEYLVDGMLDVKFVATRPGYGNLGNAIEPDFSRLVVQTLLTDDDGGGDDHAGPGPIPPPPPIIDPGPGPRPQPVPLPPALIPASALLLGIVATSKRRLRG